MSKSSSASPSRRAVVEALLAVSKGWAKKTAPKSDAEHAAASSAASSADHPDPKAARTSGLPPLSPGRPGPAAHSSTPSFQNDEPIHGLRSAMAPPQAKFFGGLDARDRALAERLYRGVLQNLRVIDLLLERGAELNPKRTREAMKWVLRLAVYQHIFLDSVPPHALVHQSVELGREFGNERAGGYVNAILRRLLPLLPDNAAGLPETLERMLGRRPSPAELYSVPDAVAAALESGYGKDPMRSLLRSFNDSAPRVWLRVNSLRTTPEALAERLAEEGVETQSNNLVPGSLRPAPKDSSAAASKPPARSESGPPAESSEAPSESPAKAPAPWNTDCWDRGELTVQDAGAMLAGHLLAPQPGEAVLDWCAAPGGKTGHLWELMGGKGHLVAVEKDNDRRQVLIETLQRLYGPPSDSASGPDSSFVTAPAVLSLRDTLSSKFTLQDSGGYKAILLDVPCIGFGLLGRHSEARWDGRIDTLDRVTQTQASILEVAARHLAPGGRLLWATCSPTRAEVEDVILPFIESHPSFSLVDLADRTPEWARPWVQIDSGILRTRPDLAAKSGSDSGPQPGPIDCFAYAMIERTQ